MDEHTYLVALAVFLVVFTVLALIARAAIWAYSRHQDARMRRAETDLRRAETDLRRAGDELRRVLDKGPKG